MMNLKIPSILASLVILIAMAANAQPTTLAARPPQPDPPLRVAEPVEAIAADLEEYRPRYMQEQQIPGTEKWSGRRGLAQPTFSSAGPFAWSITIARGVGIRT